MSFSYRTKKIIFWLTQVWLFRQMANNKWPFNRMVELEEIDKFASVSAYHPKFTREPVNSAIRPIHVDRPEVTTFCQQFDESPFPEFPEIGVIELQDTLVHLPTCVHRFEGVILRNGILDDRLFTHIKYLTVFLSLTWRSPRKAGTAVLLGLPYIKNYFHWLVEILPRIQLVENDPAYDGVPWILPAQVPRYVREIISAAGYDDRVEYLASGTYQFEHLILPTTMSYGAGPNHPKELAWLRQKFLPQPMPQATRRIWVSRRDAQSRFLLDEDAILQRLASLGFELVCPGELDFAAKVKVFSEAQMIVGPHGASLTHVVFAPDNAGLVEIFPQDYFSNGFSQIAKLRDWPYGVVVGTSKGRGIQVDIDEVEATVKQTLALVEARSSQIELSNLG
mgnify:CR=1 FL=1